MSQLIYSIKDVFGQNLQGYQKYYIPSYQRGYKWSMPQIQALLLDIERFEHGGDDERFYCIQNITLVEDKDGNFNVVDGQQRLTTSFLLLVYLGEKELVKGKISYQIRASSNIFLERLCEEDAFLLKVRELIDEYTLEETSKAFGRFLDEFSKDYDHQDIFFMFQALHCVHAYFKKKPDTVRKYFTEKFLHHVKLITNKIKNTDEQSLFSNLNTGMVALDGADLVRAILITRVARATMLDYDSSSIQDILQLHEKRVRIGLKLDELMAWWSQESVQTYFGYFSKGKIQVGSKVAFDRQKHPINLLYQLWASKAGDQALSLSLFEGIELIPSNIYDELINLHRTLKDWYEDREIYHLLGYWAVQCQSNKREDIFSSAYQLWEGGSSRVDFTHAIKKQIQTSLFGELLEEGRDILEEFQDNFNDWLKLIEVVEGESKVIVNWYGMDKLPKLLILLDVIHLSKVESQGLAFLPPPYFRAHQEDKEHIYPQTPSRIKDFKNGSWDYESLQQYWNKLKEDFSLKRALPITKEKWNNALDVEKEALLQELHRELHKHTPINTLGNLVLLERSTNRGIGNNYYLDKRHTVLKSSKKGKYIRPHTLQVFVKEEDKEQLNNWVSSDIQRNAQHIAQTLRSFFSE